jgi:hypothetical protein
MLWNSVHSDCEELLAPAGNAATIRAAVLRNRAILPRFWFRFRVPNFLATVPALVPVPTLKFKVIFS